MIVNTIHPDLLTIGPLTIRFYGIVYALGFLFIAYYISKQKIKNLDKDKAYDLITYGLVGGLIGGRLFHVFSEWSFYQNNLINILFIWNGGLGFQGGILGAILIGYWYAKKHEIDLIRVLDKIVLPLPVILFFGRIANFMNHENFGLAAEHLSWCTKFVLADYGYVTEVTPEILSAIPCRHPTQMYQALAQIIFFALLFALTKFSWTQKWTKRKGNMTWTFVFGYGLIRFTTDYYRLFNVSWFGLFHTQVFGIIMMIVGIVMLAKNCNKEKHKKS